jgi:hypothetical protein
MVTLTKDDMTITLPDPYKHPQGAVFRWLRAEQKDALKRFYKTVGIKETWTYTQSEESHQVKFRDPVLCFVALRDLWDVRVDIREV